MKAFEVVVNGERLCLAGIAGNCVLSVTITHLKRNGDRDEIDLEVAGLVSAAGEHVDWAVTPLRTDDEVRIKIIDSDSADEPKERRPRNPEEELVQQKQYVREMAKQLGWTLTEHLREI
jgi:hypothetical protein